METKDNVTPMIEGSELADAIQVLREEINTNEQRLPEMKKQLARTEHLIGGADEYKRLLDHPGYKRLKIDMEAYLDQILVGASQTDPHYPQVCQHNEAVRSFYHRMTNTVIGAAGEGGQSLKQWREIKKTQQAEIKVMEASLAAAIKTLAAHSGPEVH